MVAAEMPQPPNSPETPREAEPRGWRGLLPDIPWPLLVAMLGVVVAAVTLLEVAYASSPIPPGVDPGDWITRGGAYVGLSVPPVAAFGGPYIYPPLIFPFLGGLLLFLGSPVTTGFVAGALLILFLGLSLIFVATRFIRFGPLQLAFVGVCLFSATLIYMLMWGAYPNFFAFVLLNLTLVYFLTYARTGNRIAGFLLGVSLSLLYLTHSLTFAIGIVTVAVAAVLILLVAGPAFVWQRLRNRGLIAGVATLVATVGIYTLVLRIDGIVPPNYFESNPAALNLDNIGQLFAPLSSGPMFFPDGPAVYLSPIAAMVILSGVAAVLVITHSLVHHFRPRWVTIRHTVAVAAVVAALITPVAGSLARVGTDYPRFVYFLPIPIVLLVAVTIDTAIRPWVTGSPMPQREVPGSTRSLYRRPTRTTLTVGYLATGVVLVLLFTNVSVPSTLQLETVDTGNTHSPQFLAATEWLANNPTPGSVLTLQGTARWVEALTHRGTYDESNSWLDFETWELVNTQLTYWAFNSQYAVTDGSAIESYTPGSTSLLSQSPMYSVFDEGVVFPIVRLLPGDLSATVATANGTSTVAGAAWGPGILTVNSTSGVGTISYSNSWFDASIFGALASPGAATINLTIVPRAGTSLTGVTVSLASPPADVALMHLPSSQSVALTGDGFSWLSSGVLGQLPGTATVNTSGQFNPAPVSMVISTLPANQTLTSTFLVPSGSRSFSVSLLLATPGTGNPGVTLPLVLDTEAFLQARDIHFLILAVGVPYAPTIAFYQTVFGFTTVYQNSGWEVLEG